jgi:hypothetical protein
MKDTTLRSVIVLVALSLVATTANAQRRQDRPRPPEPIPTREPQVGPRQPERPCDLAQWQPSITLTLQPAVIYPGDRATVSWEVKHKSSRDLTPWGWDVTLSANFTVDPPLPGNPVGRRGSHTFTAPAGTGHKITLVTRCGQENAWLRVEGDATLRSVVPVLAAPDASVHLNGDGFGERQGESRVVLTAGGHELNMTVVRWQTGHVEVRVPGDADKGAASIRLVKDGRRPTPSVAFEVLGVTNFDNDRVEAIAFLLALDQASIVLNSGTNASTFTSSPVLRVTGVQDSTFSLPYMHRAVGDSYTTMLSIVLAGGLYPKRVRYGVDDMRSSSITTALENGRLVLRVAFESSGAELEGDLEGCSVFPGQCAWSDLAPDGNLDHAQMTLRASLAARDGAVVVNTLEGEFSADVSLGRIGLIEDIARAVSEYSRSTVRRAIEDGLNREFASAELRRAIGEQITAQLRLLHGMNRVVSLRTVGNSIRIEYQ